MGDILKGKLGKNMHKSLPKNSKLRNYDWTKSPEYREAVMLKVLRAMKSYGYKEWMTDELKTLGLSL